MSWRGEVGPDHVEYLTETGSTANWSSLGGRDPMVWALGGRSMGGRMCSMAVADGMPAAALVLIAYPLHPPGKPEKLRIEHLPRITVPCLFVSGTRDPFGTPEELHAATAVIPGPVTHHTVEGKGHDLKGVDAPVAQVIRDWLRSL